MLSRLFVLILVLSSVNSSVISQTLVQQIHKSSLGDDFLNILMKLYAERRFYTILVVKNPQDECLYERSIAQMPVPKLMPQLRDIFHVADHYNCEVLAIVCFDRQYDNKVFVVLASLFEQMRQQRVIVLGKDFKMPETLLPKVLEAAEDYKMTNVIVMLQPHNEERILYRVEPYPEYEVAQIEYKDVASMRLFPAKWDMRGKAILTLPDQNAPRSFMYKNRRGQYEVSGYVGKLVKLFAEYSNASLKFPFPVVAGNQISQVAIREFTKNGTIDMSIALTSLYDQHDSRNMSYPIEIGFWMFMMPCSKEVPTSDIYLMVVSSSLWLMFCVILMLLSMLHTAIEYVYLPAMRRNLRNADFMGHLSTILNDKVMPGLLGQSFVVRRISAPSIKITYLTVLLFGLVLSSMYGSHLKTLLTSHPNQPQIKTYDDVVKYKTKIAIVEAEVPNVRRYVGVHTYARIDSQMVVLTSPVFHRYRSSFNTSTGYTVTNSHWHMYEMQQQHYQSKLFCASDKFVFYPLMGMSLPIRGNSPYRESLDLFITRIQDMGFLSIWKTQTNCEMLANRKITLRDISQPYKLDVLRVGDLKWLWILLGFGWTLSTTVFGIELIKNVITKGRK